VDSLTFCVVKNFKVSVGRLSRLSIRHQNNYAHLDLLSEKDKEALKDFRASIDLIKLSMEIEKLFEELDCIYERKVKRYGPERLSKMPGLNPLIGLQHPQVLQRF